MDRLSVQATGKQASHKVAAITLCTHSRMVDDVVTKNKKRTGKVRCLECGAIIDDPYQGLN